jgi:predicted Zn-ribbon and HTH transcriptional regulator
MAHEENGYMIKYKCSDCGLRLETPGRCPKCDSSSVKPIMHRGQPFESNKKLDKIDENTKR